MMSTPYGQNLIVHFNIELSDMLLYHLPTTTLQATVASTFVDDVAESGGLVQADDSWPLYDPQAPQQWANVDMPILFIEGSLDLSARLDPGCAATTVIPRLLAGRRN